MPYIYYRRLTGYVWEAFRGQAFTEPGVLNSTFVDVEVISLETPMASTFRYTPLSQDYVGRYYAALAINDYNRCLVSLEPLTNPLQAKQLAETFAQQLPGSIVQIVCMVGPNPDDFKDDHNYLSFIPEIEGMPIELSQSTERSEPPVLNLACGRCGFPGHNSRRCTASKHYDRVGIEVEGRWTRNRLEELRLKAPAMGIGETGDCSIRASLINRLTRPNEFQTKPATVAGALRQLVEFYPDETDFSCGMHVHVSFLEYTHITQLVNQEFFDYFHKRWTEWGLRHKLHPNGTFFTRLNGKNEYCQRNKPNPSPFRNADRYMQLNFTAWGEHRTVECRLLPMFKSTQLGVSAVIELLSIFEDWLAKDSADLKLPSYNATHETIVANSKEHSFHFDVPAEYSKSVIADLLVIDLPPVAEGHRRIPMAAIDNNPSLLLLLEDAA